MTTAWAQPEDPATARNTAAGRPLGAVSTLISLFLLLLVFFIMLFAQGQVQHSRVALILHSVDDAFGGLPSRLGVIPVEPAPSADTNSPAGFVAAVKSLVSGMAPAGASDLLPPREGDLFSLRLSPDDLFQPGTERVSVRTERLAERLAVLLQRHPEPGKRYRLRYRLAIEETSGARFEQNIAQAAAFAGALYRAGCPAASVELTVESASAPRIYLDFALAGGSDDAG